MEVSIAATAGPALGSAFTDICFCRLLSHTYHVPDIIETIVDPRPDVLKYD